MRAGGLGLCLMVAGVGLAGAAELPSRKTDAPPPPAKRCEIAGKPGFLLSDGQTCVKLGGYVTGGVVAGVRDKD